MRPARAQPRALVVGTDADAGAMRERSAAAARPTDRGGLPNAPFVAADAEPGEAASGLPVLDAPAADALADACAGAGLRPLAVASLTAADVAGLGSSWARRLVIPDRRAARRVALQAPSDRGATAPIGMTMTPAVRVDVIDDAEQRGCRSHPRTSGPGSASRSLDELTFAGRSCML